MTKRNMGPPQDRQTLVKKSSVLLWKQRSFVTAFCLRWVQPWYPGFGCLWGYVKPKGELCWYEETQTTGHCHRNICAGLLNGRRAGCSVVFDRIHWTEKLRNTQLFRSTLLTRIQYFEYIQPCVLKPRESKTNFLAGDISFKHMPNPFCLPGKVKNLSAMWSNAVNPHAITSPRSYFCDTKQVGGRPGFPWDSSACKRWIRFRWGEAWIHMRLRLMGLSRTMRKKLDKKTPQKAKRREMQRCWSANSSSKNNISKQKQPLLYVTCN